MVEAHASAVTSLRGGVAGLGGSSSAAATSQTSSTATSTTSQSVQSSTITQNAQASLTHSLQALQALQASQAAARIAAQNGASNLGLNPLQPGQTLQNVGDGLNLGTATPQGQTPGGLTPAGAPLTALPAGTIQIVELGNTGNGTLSLGKGGTVTLPSGTPGNDKVTVTGAGSVTTTSGTVTATAGSLTTSAGGTLSTTDGGSIALSGGTLTTVTSTTVTSSVAGTVTLANGGGQVALPANQAVTIPAGSSVALTGTGGGTVTVAGSGTVTLNGAGTLTLANGSTSGSGGTITSNTGTVSFTSGVSTSLPAGSQISLTGAGSINFASGTGGAVPVIVPNAANSASSNFTTTGTLLDTTGYQVPASWSLGTGGALSQSINPVTSHVTDTITQMQQQALLYWSTFDIGKNTTLDFDQSKGGASVGDWVAINEILSPTIAPSQILGSIQAPGQVYVINQNGIIFGGSSQVNVGALTASSLALNPAYIANGLLNDAGNDYEFQFSSLFTTITETTGTRGHQVLTTTVAPLWTAPPVAGQGGSVTVSSVPTGDITVQAGAQLSSPTNAENQGGRIALIAPNVTNDGTISTPDGQTILAAGLQVGFAAHNANDPSLRGLDVYVGQVSAAASTLPTGNFTFQGLPDNDLVTFSGSGQVGTYTTSSGTVTPINAGTPVAIPAGSTVNVTSGSPSFAGVMAGVATNSGNLMDAQGNIITPGGDIEAPRADVTMAGQTVNQMGIVNSSTSVTLNGRIDLLADYNSSAETISGQTTFYPFATGDVNLGGQSVTQILPELSSTATTIGTQLAVSSLVNIQALNIDMLAGSLLYAPGANKPSSDEPALDLANEELTSGVTLNAGSWLPIGDQQFQQESTFTNTTGQISLGAGAVIDVSGSENVSASVAEDIIPVQLRGPQLANSPLQQNGPLRGATVYVDIRDVGVFDGTPWIGTPIGDVSGYVNDVQRTVGELTANGGTVALNAGGSVSTAAGAAINVSGGWINYAGANVQTTKVVTGGQIIDISQATPNQVYQGIFTGFSSTSAKWGVTDNYNNTVLAGPEYEPGYVQGGSGGSITIGAPSMSLNGNFYGNTIAGSLQRTLGSSLSSTYAGSSALPTILNILGVPEASSLDLSFLDPKVGLSGSAYTSSSPDVLFETDSYISQNTPAANQLFLSQDIVDSDGFGTLKIDTSASGSITVPEDVSLTTSPGGLLSFTAANIDIEGNVAAPGGGSTGGLDFTVLDISPTIGTLQSTPAPDLSRGQFTLGPDASLSSTGLVVDDRPGTADPGTLPYATSGGSISIAALNVDLAPGSTIDVSGGVSINSSGKETYGNAGSITILGGEDPQYSSLVSGGHDSADPKPGLLLGSTLTGYSGNAGGGGSLTIQSPLVQIGGSTLLNGDSSQDPFVQGETSVSSNGTTLWLDKSGGSDPPPDFFSQGGFGNFTIEGIGQIETNSSGAYIFNSAGDPVMSPAVLITANTVIDPIVESYVGTLSNNSVVLAPLTPDQAAGLLPSERTAVNLTFDAEGVVSGFGNDTPPTDDGSTYSNNAGGGGIMVRGDLIMQAGAKIQTDPQTNSSHGVSLLAPKGMVAVLGSVVAPGGTITVKGGNTSSFSNNQLLIYESSPDEPFPTVDLGPDSVLSTAGTTELTLNNFGVTTGSVLPGGNIVITGNIVGEAGAVLNVSGASAMLSQTPDSLGYSANQLTSLGLVPTREESNAGSITLTASQLLFSDATLLGDAGGSSAQGGTLSVSSGFAVTNNPNVTPPTPVDVNLIVTQQGLNGGFVLPSDYSLGLSLFDGQVIPGASSEVGGTVNSAAGGQPVYSYFAANPNLFLSTTFDHSVSNNGGQAGGFGTLNLNGTLDFVGRINIDASNSISLAGSTADSASGGTTGGVIYADSNVNITAPYVSLNGYENSYSPDAINQYPAATGGTGTLTINANTLADVGNMSLQDISTLTFNSDPTIGGDIQGIGTLQVAGQINLNAGQIYPPTESVFTIEANDVSITAPTSQTTPALPLSGGGTLNIFANTIEQDGVLRAPFGIINLGNSSTQSVTLSNGSITSVSGVDPKTGLGITVPYGILNANGDWYDPQGNDITLTGPPAKAVNITSANVDVQQGSTVDLTGGGELFAYQFNSGTGGTQDILGSFGVTESSTSFAIIPTYSLNYAPDGTYALNNNLETNNVADAGYFNSSLSVGEQIYLNASSGLPAGNYTLLPARYALLPGAFLVTPGSGGAPGASVTEPDGSSLVSGYVTTSLNPTTSPVYGAYQIYSQSTVLKRAPYTISQADTYFPLSAANHNTSVPRLPVDAGQLVLDATQTMTIQGTLLSQAAAGGLGGEVDIASPEDIYIVGPNATNVPAGALVLDSSQLTDFGAASLLIGGYRTTTDAGTSVTVTTDDLVVDNSGATTTIGGTTVDGLAAPDVILVSDATLDLADNAEIEQFGQLSGKAQTLTLQGNGALLRVSSDSSAQIIRQNVTAGDTTSDLSIGQGVQIQNTAGQAVGSLILDSSDLIQISNSTTAAPVLMSKALTLDSSLINLELGTPATAPTTGLVITQPLLDSLLSSTQSLSLLSYTSIAIYGSGQIGSVTVDSSGDKTYQEASLALHADDIYYADTQNSSGVTINAQTVSLDNLAGGTALPSLGGLGMGSLTINAQAISLGSGAMQMDQFSSVALNADSAILLRGLGTTVAGSDNTPTPASFSTSGNLTLTAPLITSGTSADQPISSTTTSVIDQTISAGGALVTQAPVNDPLKAPSPGALAAQLSLIGSSVTQNSGSIVLHSGSLALQANGAPGSAGGTDVVVNGTVDLTGVSPAFYNLTKFTNGGQAVLSSFNGNVTVGSTGLVNVSAVSGVGEADSLAGNAGSVTVNAAGTFTPGQIKGQAGVVTQALTGTILSQGTGGSFSLNVGSLDATGGGNGLLSSVETGLTGFTQQTIRDRNDSTVTVDDTVRAGSFDLSADAGSIIVTGLIDASNVASIDPYGNPILVGGTIGLQAGGSVTLQSGSELTVAGSQLNNAGQGGAVTLEAGAYEGSSSSTSAAINLMQGSQIDLSVNGSTGGTLLLRAPQVSGSSYVSGAGYTPVAVNAAGGGTPTDVAIGPIASGIVENASNITVEGFYVQDAQQSNALIDSYESTAESNAAAFMAQASSIQSRIFGSNTANVNIQPGEEIDNSTGNLELQNTWDLSTLRYGGEPGVLTIRAAGNINVDFGASLNDGFDGSAGVSYSNVLLPVGSQSWSYNITTGADFTGANSGDVQTAAQLQGSGLGGSLQVGYQANSSSPTLLSQTSADNLSQFFQTIRTGTGSITINSGGSVLLLNNLATIYTAGSQVDPTLGGTFAPPAGTDANGFSDLAATYSTGGGNVAISAQGEIAHLTYSSDGSGSLVADSSDELPTNWLDREGAVSGGQIVTPTTWWVDFTNFFEGIGALGGGNVTLNAGGSIVNVDASIPTNAREVNGQLTELGGGDLVVNAGNNIDAGVYYIEKGQATLNAGGNIVTNSTRTVSVLGQPTSSIEWLPTTFFLGKGSFSVSAQENALVGPTANPFLLPQSVYNVASTTDTTSQISYFSTYAPTDAVNVATTDGTLTIKDSADGTGQGSLYDWYLDIDSAAYTNPQPGTQISGAETWLRLAATATPAQTISNLGPATTLPLGSPDNVFGGLAALLPPTLRATAYSGDIDLIGSLTLSPSAVGTIDLAASGSINAFEVNQVSANSGTPLSGSALINLSDADPSALPSVTSPFASSVDLLSLDSLFTETGATEGLPLQVKELLHAKINDATLHANDPNPVYIIADSGDISGLTLFSAKQAQVVAGQDITDIGLYIQNNNANDISLVQAGRDIIAYDASAPLREAAGSQLIGADPVDFPEGTGPGAPNSGDIQISGPGTLEVLAGRNLTLGNDNGVTPNNTDTGDGLDTGLTSVGGQRNPSLPFGGATITAAAGLGSDLSSAAGLGSNSAGFSAFITEFLNPSGSFSSTYLPDLATDLGPDRPDQHANMGYF